MIRCAPGSLTNLGWLYRVFHVRRWGRAVSLGWCAGLEPEGQVKLTCQISYRSRNTFR